MDVVDDVDGVLVEDGPEEDIVRDESELAVGRLLGVTRVLGCS